MNMENEVTLPRRRVGRWRMARIRRFAVLLAAVTGLLALLAEPAQAGITLQHCEPLLRR
jgi:hypothetical protein